MGKALGIYEKQGWPYSAACARYELGTIHQKGKGFRLAKKFYLESIEAIEECVGFKDKFRNLAIFQLEQVEADLGQEKSPGSELNK